MPKALDFTEGPTALGRFGYAVHKRFWSPTPPPPSLPPQHPLQPQALGMGMGMGVVGVGVGVGVGLGVIASFSAVPPPPACGGASRLLATSPCPSLDPLPPQAVAPVGLSPPEFGRGGGVPVKVRGKSGQTCAGADNQFARVWVGGGGAEPCAARVAILGRMPPVVCCTDACSGGWGSPPPHGLMDQHGGRTDDTVAREVRFRWGKRNVKHFGCGREMRRLGVTVPPCRAFRLRLDRSVPIRVPQAYPMRIRCVVDHFAHGIFFSVNVDPSSSFL